MALFNQRVGERSSPTASLEALQEINTICNDIALSQPALEALFDLPNLASQFNQVNSAPSIAMLEFVTQQKYEALGIEDFSVATEGILSSVGSGIKKAYDWLMKKLTQLGEWVKSFFRKKPVEQMQADVKQAETVVKASAAAIDEKIKEVHTGKPSPSNIPVNMPHQSYKTPQSSGTSGNIPSHAPMMHVVAQVINKPNVTVQELVEVKKIVVDTEKVVSELMSIMPHLINIVKDVGDVGRHMDEWKSDLARAEKHDPTGVDPIGRGDTLFQIGRVISLLGRVTTSGPVLLNITDKILKDLVTDKDPELVKGLERTVSHLKSIAPKLEEGIHGVIMSMIGVHKVTINYNIIHARDQEEPAAIAEMLQLIEGVIYYLDKLKTSSSDSK